MPCREAVHVRLQVSVINLMFMLGSCNLFTQQQTQLRTGSRATYALQGGCACTSAGQPAGLACSWGQDCYAAGRCFSFCRSAGRQLCRSALLQDLVIS